MDEYEESGSVGKLFGNRTKELGEKDDDELMDEGGENGQRKELDGLKEAEGGLEKDATKGAEGAPVKTILRFGKTCQRYRDLVLRTASLQLHIELDVSGLQVSSGTSSLNMLNDLRAYRKAWENLNLEPDFRKVQHNIRGVDYWNIYNNVLFKCARSTVASTGGSVFVAPLETGDCLIPVETETFSALAVDLHQELIVLVSLNNDYSSSSFGAHVNLVSSMTGGPHPNANLPTFRAERLILPEFDLDHGAQIPSVALMSEMLLISFGNHRIGRYTILTWNWKTGGLYQALSDKGHLRGIAWLDQSHFVALVGIGAPKVRDLCLRVYVLRSAAPNCPPSRNASTHSAEPNRPLLQLNFPALREDKYISVGHLGTTLLAQPDCIPSRPIKIGSTTFSYPRVPTLGIKLILSGGSRFHIFACVDCLLQLIQNQSKTLSWSEWGVMGTRWLVDEPPRNAGLDRDPQMGMSTSRYIRFLPDDAAGGDDEDSEGSGEDERDESQVGWKDDKVKDGLLCVLDFKHSCSKIDLNEALTEEQKNLIRCGRWPFSNYNVSVDTILKEAPSSPNNPPQYSEGMIAIVVGSDAPTILREKEGFDEPVESRLPYRLVARRRPVPRGIHPPWMMGHDKIIGLQVAFPNVMAAVYKLDY